MISLKNVSKLHGKTCVVDDVSVDIPQGGITAIIGPNGAGKSSLLSMISRLMPMSSGRVRVDSLDVNDTKGDVLAKRLAILKQENQIVSRLTVQELVMFGRYPHSKGRHTATDKQHVQDALGYLGLDDLRERYLDELSGGQRQRAYVAMVLAQDTDYILLDEPLNNLDIKHAVAMMRLIRRAAKEFEKTIVIVLHDINFASCYADNIIVMKAGKLAYQGIPADVITPEIMLDVYDVKLKVHKIDDQIISVYYD